LPGVNLGQCCVVGAGSIVRDSFPDFSVLAGVPARLVKILEQ
jgi:acetyltransferase-like isoleucine patch superfamily enzyme